MSQKERPVRGSGAMRQILRMQRRRGDGETVPGRTSVRPVEQKNKQV